jgi:hypothetical protein
MNMPDRDVKTIPPTTTPAYDVQGQAFEGRLALRRCSGRAKPDLIYYQSAAYGG